MSATWLKVLVGALLVIGGIYWYFITVSLGTGLTNLQALALAFKSVFGIIVLIIGAFIVWLEADELKVQRDEKREKREEEKAEKKDEKELTEAEKIKSAVVQSERKEDIGRIEYKIGRLSKNETRSALLMIQKDESPLAIEKEIKKPIHTILKAVEKYDPNSTEVLEEYKQKRGIR